MAGKRNRWLDLAAILPAVIQALTPKKKPSFMTRIKRGAEDAWDGVTDVTTNRPARKVYWREGGKKIGRWWEDLWS